VFHRRKPERGQSVVEFALVFPLMIVLLLAIVDFARIYTTMMSVESAAREAADYGTTLGAGKWQAGAPMDGTVAEMQKRACVASSNLPDYVDPDGDPTTGCTNPSFDYCMTAPLDPSMPPPPPPEPTCGPVNPSDGCEVPTRPKPCIVTVTLSYQFHLLSPFHIQFFDVSLGLPSTIDFQRNSTFAMTDIDLTPPVPGP
jgi:hypothetical protein